MNRYIVIGLFIVSISVAFALIGCNSKKENRAVTIGFMVKFPEEPWFQKEIKGARKCGDKYGFKVVDIGARDGDQVLAGIDNLAAQGAKGFVICAPDVRLGPAIMAKAESYKMKVFTVDDQFIGADGKFMNVPYIGLAARDIGRSIGKYLFDEMKKRGWKIEDTGACVVTYDQLDTVRERTEGGTEALTQAGFPAEKIYRVPESIIDQPGAFAAANIIVTQHPDVKKWIAYSVNDEAVLGSVRALENHGFNVDSIIAVGIGGATSLPELEKEKPTGFIGTCFVDCVGEGYKSAEYLYKWINEGITPPMDTRSAGTIVTRETFRKVMTDAGFFE
ncbi:MAG: substrate-binding domain-containing protein [Candidatus Latescibacterota bacterium]